jgi:Ca-activated chloride channel family protein
LALPLILAVAVPAAVATTVAQDARPTFKASVARVTLSATVRTSRGRPITNLQASDFQLFDSGQPRPIVDFRTDPTPVSIGFLVDFSGSMGVAARRAAAREQMHHLISWLEPGRDRAGLFVFDKTLQPLQPLAPAPGSIMAHLDSVKKPFGSTSLWDAIAETGSLLAENSGPRRAVVALTDGSDNSSRLTASEVSGLASSIDVPVYIIVVQSPYDFDGRASVNQADIDAMLNGPLGNLARWTGGEIYTGLGAAQASKVASQIVTELRQQYLIAFEPDGRPGWHPIELRTKNPDLVVRARSGYIVN